MKGSCDGVIEKRPEVSPRPRLDPVFSKAPCRSTVAPLGAASCCSGKDYRVNNNKMAGRAQKKRPYSPSLATFSLILVLSPSAVFVLPAGLPGCHVLPSVSSHAEAVA